MNECYKCKYRGTIPGNCHSKCEHPKIKRLTENPIGAIISLLGAKRLGTGEEEFESVRKELNIQANAHGIRSGWFLWPFNFDPVWLENCDGFTPVEEKTE